MPEQQSILELASTKELLEELHRRSEVFAYVMRPLVKDPDSKWDFVFGCSRDGGQIDKGAVIRGVGYMELAKQLLLKET
jgi:hypothetical protein